MKVLAGARAPWRTTTAQAAALYPFIAEGGLGTTGCFIGSDFTGTAFCYDPWDLYRRRIITSPNAIVIGEIGSAKSSLAKSIIWREVGAFGKRAWVIDPKGEYDALCAALGTRPLKLQPGGGIRLNPLGATTTQQERLSVLLAVTAASLDRALRPAEEAALRAALEAAGTDREVVLPEVVDLLHEPVAAMAEELHTTKDKVKADAREAALALEGLCSGALAGMFDGPTTEGIDLLAPLVVLDLSAMQGHQSLGILMACATAALRGELRKGDGKHTFLIVDEGWRVLAHQGVAEWLQESWKLSRALGLSGWAIMHRFSDLLAAGDAGTRQVRLAEGLLADTQTRVIYRQAPDEVERSREYLGLSEAEMEIVSHLQPGQALWHIAGERFLVRHELSETEKEIVDTNQRM